MSRVPPALLLLLLGACRSAAPPAAAAPSPAAQAARPSFEQLCATQPCRPAGRVNLWVEGREISREAPPSPYVYRDAVYVFAGDDFSVTGDIEGDRLVHVRRVEAGEKPALELHVKFEQRRAEDGTAPMMLTLQSGLPRSLKYRAFMVPVSGDGSLNDFVPTSSCPVRAGLMTFESWPHPIDTLVLGELHFVDDAGEAGSACE